MNATQTKPETEAERIVREEQEEHERQRAAEAGASKTHRRDKEGDVDAIVETKSLIVTDLHLGEEAAEE